MLTLRVIFFQQSDAFLQILQCYTYYEVQVEFFACSLSFFLCYFFQICKYDLCFSHCNLSFSCYFGTGISFKYNLVLSLSHYIIANLITKQSLLKCRESCFNFSCINVVLYKWNSRIPIQNIVDWVFFKMHVMSKVSYKLIYLYVQYFAHVHNIRK